MFARLVATPRRIVHALVAHDAPGQLALGFTLGMVVGLIPKGNLIALSLCVLLFSMRVNKGLSILALVLFSWVGTFCDPLTHKLGASALGVHSLQTCYASVFSLPLGPWFGLDNTVTTGSLLLGLYLAYPVYWLTRVVCSRLLAVQGKPVQGVTE